jgi:chromosome segregation ATPase
MKPNWLKAMYEKELRKIIGEFREDVEKLKKQVSEFYQDNEAFATLRRDIDELKGNYEHNTVPTLENCRDFVISVTVEVDGLKDRVQGLDASIQQDAGIVNTLAARINALEARIQSIEDSNKQQLLMDADGITLLDRINSLGAQVRALQSHVTPELLNDGEVHSDVPYTAKSERIFIPGEETPEAKFNREVEEMAYTLKKIFDVFRGQK